MFIFSLIILSLASACGVQKNTEIYEYPMDNQKNLISRQGRFESFSKISQKDSDDNQSQCQSIINFIKTNYHTEPEIKNECNISFKSDNTFYNIINRNNKFNIFAFDLDANGKSSYNRNKSAELDTLIRKIN